MRQRLASHIGCLSGGRVVADVSQEDRPADQEIREVRIGRIRVLHLVEYVAHLVPATHLHKRLDPSSVEVRIRAQVSSPAGQLLPLFYQPQAFSRVVVQELHQQVVDGAGLRPDEVMRAGKREHAAQEGH